MENQVLFSAYVFPACACSAPQDLCAAACSADLCANQNPGQACLSCINMAIVSNDPCFTTSLMNCQSDPKCSPLLDCVGTYCGP